MLQSELNKLRAENEFLKSNNKLLQQELDDSKFEMEGLNKKSSNFNQELQVLKTKLEMFEKENEFLKKLYNDVTKSDIYKQNNNTNN